MKRVTYNGLEFEPYITRDMIASRVGELARQITQDCEGRMPLFLCVLNGAFAFASDLFRAVDTNAEISFIRLKSYEGMGSTGVVKEVLGLSEDIAGRTVIVVEDIVDTGKTIKRLVEDLKAKNPAEVKVATVCRRTMWDSRSHLNSLSGTVLTLTARHVTFPTFMYWQDRLKSLKTCNCHPQKK